ncbi:MAG: hypothetical protein ACOYXW_19560 [Actinomycetota bacterium]
MADWGWVALGFGTAYGSIAGYLLVLRARGARARRQIEELR